MLKTYMNPLYSDIKKYTYNKITMTSAYCNSNNYPHLFYLLKFENIKDDEVLDNLYLELRSSQYDINDKYDVYVIDESSLSSSNVSLLADKINEGTYKPLMLDVSKVRDDENSQDVVQVMLKNLNKTITANKSIIIGLKAKETYTSAATSYFQGYAINTHNVTAKVFSTLGVTDASKIDKYEYDENTKVMVDEFDGNVITNVNLFSTLNKKAPINLSIVGNNNKISEISYLPNNLMMNYQYEIETETINNSCTGYIIKDATGKSKRYFIVNSSNEDDYGKYFNHGRSATYKYYCEEDGSCMYLNAGSTTYLYVYDKNRTKGGLLRV